MGNERTDAGRQGSGFDHPLCGSDPLTLLTVLARNGLADHRHLPQMAAITVSVLLRAPFSAAEAVWFAGRRRRMPPMRAPLFIIGHWRSGTTHLYNVLSRDPQFGFIPPLAVGLPWDMFGLGTMLRPLLERALPKHRYIDNVPVKPDSPQEDEIALANMSPLSFYHGLSFPSHFHDNLGRGLFLEGCPPAEIERWRRRFVYFLEKVSVHQGNRRLLIKNPVYSARVAMLAEIWPDAQFIHIHRNPHAVFVSMLNFYRKLFAKLALQAYDHIDIEQVVLDSYPRLMQRLVDETARLPSSRFVDVAFEEFERAPLEVVERIYDSLGLSGLASARPHFEAYLATVRNYAKNNYRMADETRERVERAWGPFVARWGPKAASPP